MKLLTIPRGIVDAVAYSSDGRWLVSVYSCRHVCVWDRATFRQRFRTRLHAHTLPDVILHTHTGGMLAVSNQVWDLGPLLELAGQPGAFPSGPLKAVSFQDTTYSSLAASADGRQVVGVGWVRSFEGHFLYEFRLWDIRGRCVRRAPLERQPWQRVAFSPEARTVALSAGRMVLLWDALDCRELTRLDHTDEPLRLTFSPNGKQLAVSAGRSVWVWDVARGKALAKFPAFRQHSEALVFSPDGRFLAAGSGEGEVRLWEAGNLREVARHDWGIGAIQGLAFAPDGLTMAASGHDHALAIWDVEY